MGAREENKALETVAADFTELYPNCKIQYEYLQDYSESLIKRLDSDTDKIDLFVTGNIVADSDRREYALDYMDKKIKWIYLVHMRA